MGEWETRGDGGFLAREWPYVVAVVLVVCIGLGYAASRGVLGPVAGEVARVDEGDWAPLQPKEMSGAGVALEWVLRGLVLGSWVWVVRARLREGRVFPGGEPCVARWGEWDVAKLACVYVVLAAVLVSPWPVDRLDLLLSSSALAGLAGTWVGVQVIRSRGQDATEVLGLSWSGLGRHLVPAAAVFVALLPLFVGTNVVWVYLVERVTGAGLDVHQRMVKEMVRTSSAGVVGQILVSAVLVAPVVEEFFFRGLVYGALRRRVRRWIAMPAVGVLFGLIHTPVTTVVPMAVLGTMLCYTYEKTGRLVVPMVLHCLFNVTMLMFIICYRVW